MGDSTTQVHTSCHGKNLSRREVLRLGGALALGGGVAGTLKWHHQRESGSRASVFIAQASGYDDDLVRVISTALAELGIGDAEIKGKRILLKPNLVETSPGQRHINTHPSIVVAVAEVFRRLGAADIVVAEGQGHRRDSLLVLEESGMDRALAGAHLPFVDLNHADFAEVRNRGTETGFSTLFIPKPVLSADWVVSLPKLKTHHWAGMTCAMKNLFGIMPGLVYGWPKNPLHRAGIAQSIVDINTTVPTSLSIVDGIVGMEGDGPIMGYPKPTGCVIIGRNATAVDATCARIMGFDPNGITYLAAASGRLGPVREENITQRGAGVASVLTPYDLVDAPHLRNVRAPRVAPETA